MVVAVAAPTTQTQVNMDSDLSRIEQVAAQQVSAHSFQLFTEIDTVAENATANQSSILGNEAATEIHRRDEQNDRLSRGMWD